MVQTINIDEAKALLEQKQVALLDARDRWAYDKGHIEGATWLGKVNFLTICTKLAKQQKILVYCNRGNTSQAIGRILVGQGFNNVYSIDGGFESWRQKYS